MYLLFLLALAFLAAWLITFVAFHVTTGLIHLILVAAVILFAIGLLRRAGHFARHVP